MYHSKTLTDVPSTRSFFYMLFRSPLFLFNSYYFDGRHSVLSMFMDTSIMDSLKSKIESFLSMGNARIPGKPVWLGETSSAYNTGTPGISNSYVAGFLCVHTTTDHNHMP